MCPSARITFQTTRQKIHLHNFSLASRSLQSSALHFPAWILNQSYLVSASFLFRLQVGLGVRDVQRCPCLRISPALLLRLIPPGAPRCPRAAPAASAASMAAHSAIHGPRTIAEGYLVWAGRAGMDSRRGKCLPSQQPVTRGRLRAQTRAGSCLLAAGETTDGYCVRALLKSCSVLSWCYSALLLADIPTYLPIVSDPP